MPETFARNAGLARRRKNRFGGRFQEIDNRAPGGVGLVTIPRRERGCHATAEAVPEAEGQAAEESAPAAEADAPVATEGSDASEDAPAVEETSPPAEEAKS